MAFSISFGVSQTLLECINLLKLLKFKRYLRTQPLIFLCTKTHGCTKDEKTFKKLYYFTQKIPFKEFWKKRFRFNFFYLKPSAWPSPKKLLLPKQKQKQKKLLPSAEASAFGPLLKKQGIHVLYVSKHQWHEWPILLSSRQ